MDPVSIISILTGITSLFGKKSENVDNTNSEVNAAKQQTEIIMWSVGAIFIVLLIVIVLVLVLNKRK